MLTNRDITSAKPKTSPYYIWDKTKERGVAGKGRLGVQVSRAGSKSFKFRYFVNSKTKFIHIGSYPSISLAKARETAKKYSTLLEQGLDPKQELERQHQLKVAMQIEESKKASIRDLFESHRDHKKSEGKRHYQTDFNNLVKHVYPFLSPDTKAKNVTANDIVIILRDPILRGAPSTSNKVRTTLHSAFNYGLSHDNDPAKDISVGKFGLTHNPVSAIPRQKSADKVGNHFLSPAELFKLLHDLEHRTHDLKMHESTRQIMRLCFYLGGQRPTEVCNLKWSDIDEEEMIVTIPDYVSKTKKELLIALTKSSYSLLTKHRETSNSPYIFPKLTNPEEATPVNTISQAVGRYRSRAGISPFIARDFRRTFKTLTGQLNISKELRDRVQGHTPNDASNKHYDRYDYMVQKREVMEKWCTYLENGIAKHEISPDFNYSG